MDTSADETWLRIAEAFVSGLSVDWLSRMPEGMIFELSMPNDNRGGLSKLRIERVPESDAEAISRAMDRQDRNLEPVEDKTLRDTK